MSVIDRLQKLIYTLNEGICQQRELVAECEKELGALRGPARGTEPAGGGPLAQSDRERLYTMARSRGEAGESFFVHISQATTMEQGVAIAAALREVPKVSALLPDQVEKVTENGHGHTPTRRRK